MSEATAKYWAARCRRGAPPGPGSPCAALLWATDEIERLRAMRGRVQYVHDNPAGWTSARAITRHILGEPS
jgi:hypothetical protein